MNEISMASIAVSVLEPGVGQSASHCGASKQALITMSTKTVPWNQRWSTMERHFALAVFQASGLSTSIPHWTHRSRNNRSLRTTGSSSLVSTSLLALVLGVLIEAASKPIQEELEGGGSGGAGFGPDSTRTKSGKLVEIRGEETALTMLTSSKTRQALEAIEELRKKGVDEATIEKSDEMRALNRLREEVRAEVAAVRIWLFETGRDLQVRKSTIPMPSSPASMLRRQREIELENQAKVQELSDGFSHEELHEARERLVTTTGHKKLADVPENVVQKEAAIKFSIGNTQSTVSSVEEMLERKRKRREQILKEEAAAREEDPWCEGAIVPRAMRPVRYRG